MFDVVTGKVIRYDESRGYGFIAPDEGGEDVFLHVNDLAEGKSLVRPGQRVTFEVQEGGRGLKASSVRLTDSDSVVPLSVSRHSVAAAIRPPGGDAEAEDGMCDLLTATELRQEVTEALLAVAPEMTGDQILKVRERVIKLAVGHNWVES